MTYVIQYLDDHILMSKEIKPNCVRKLNDTLFLVKIKRNVTKPRLFQIKHNFKAATKQDWWLCEVQKVVGQVTILEFHKGVDVWNLLNNKD